MLHEQTDFEYPVKVNVGNSALLTGPLIQQSLPPESGSGKARRSVYISAARSRSGGSSPWLLTWWAISGEPESGKDVQTL